MRKIKLILLFTLFIVYSSWSQVEELPFETNEKSWFENIKIGGYIQTRYSRILNTGSDLSCTTCDSWAGGNGFALPSVRLKLSGNIGQHIYFYIQPEFASAVNGNKQHFTQLKDAYFDVSVDKKKEFRFRLGRSKIPYGFSNLQSSQSRLPLDDIDGINGGQDLGLIFYWAPEKTRNLFRELSSEGLKGTGDYGVIGFGVYNGQTANALELNDNLHIVGRISYPIQIKGQIIEPGIQAYTGQYQLSKSQLSTGINVKESLNYLDQRVAATFVLYPQPFGIQTEYNWGTGPEFNNETGAVEQTHLEGGYATLSYKLTKFKQLFYPFIRYQYYDGGDKLETDARSYQVSELAIGLEWRPLQAFELVAEYTIANRKYEDYLIQDSMQNGRLLRLQAQVNF